MTETSKATRLKRAAANPWVRLTLTAGVLAIPFVLAKAFGQTAEHGAAENAAGHAAGHEAGLPTVVLLQFVNFFLYVALVVYFARKPIVEYFKNRRAKFDVALKRADAARAEATAKRAETQARLAKLESTREESIQQARTDSAALRAQIVEEARSLSAKLQLDAQKTAELEVERAKHVLREDLVNQSVALAQRILSDRTKVQDQDQKRLQDEFVQKIDQKTSQMNSAVTT